MMTEHRRRGFTLVELLVVVGITVLLAALGVGVSLSTMERTRMMTEVNAARNLMSGYHNRAAEQGGQVVPGYQAEEGLTDLDGEPLHYPVNARYPWKLAPHVGSMERAVVFNGNEKLLDQDNGDYRVSVAPNLGLNATFVGGHFGSGSPLPPSGRVIETFGKFHVTATHEVEDPALLVVFASARSREGEDGVGYYEVRPPKVRGPLWSSDRFDEEAEPSAHGFVDFRWGGKAVVAMFGGNVEILDEETLRDMRRWSNDAARQNDPDYVVRPLGD